MSWTFSCPMECFFISFDSVIHACSPLDSNLEFKHLFQWMWLGDFLQILRFGRHVSSSALYAETNAVSASFGKRMRIQHRPLLSSKQSGQLALFGKPFGSSELKRCSYEINHILRYVFPKMTWIKFDATESNILDFGLESVHIVNTNCFAREIAPKHPNYYLLRKYYLVVPSDFKCPKCEVISMYLLFAKRKRNSNDFFPEYPTASYTCTQAI